MKLFAAVLGLTLFGWSLVAAADARHDAAPVEYRTITVQVEREREPNPVVPTPFADGLVDWDRVAEDEACMWELLQRRGVPLTFEVVWAAGVWADAQGGPCLMIGEDDD